MPTAIRKRSREADLFSLKLKFDLVQFLHLVFGTRYPKYRQRICEKLGDLPARADLCAR